MARPLLPLLCGAVALLLPWAAGETVRCSRPKDVANAHIDVGNNTQLNACLRYTCKPGYKRKAGTSGLIQCVLHDAKPIWTPTSLQCIRDPALPLQTPSPELPTVLPTMRTTQRAGTTGAAPTSSPSPAATPVPPVADGPSPETSTLPAMSPLLETSPPGKGMALGTTPLPTAPVDHAAVSAQILASSIGLPLLVIAGVVACCCWRMKMSAQQDYTVAGTAIPMVAPAAAAEDDETVPPGVFPTG
ncbi:interleukin-15 receptor subunit alpha-like isoform X1 [Cygnus atratus]|uniref:interleukin-15 receptor subunit alpha-like isoform X1 n=1 Tax=Cygnus atratus TaxID=8868 RepID=UPI0015D62CC1|nr:interleukin-15 receptor subunit alpha-like isoform X1 [Cygnus atratus]